MELRRRLRVRVVLLVTVALALLTTAFGVLQAPSAQAAQTIPYKINFQGRLTDNNGNALSDGYYNIKFRLWTAPTSGTNQWEADRVDGTSDYRVQVVGGLFNIQFGDTTLGDPALSPSLFSGTYPLYLEVELPTPATATCATNGCASFTEGAMTPRQTLASAAYAFNSDTLDGLDSTAFTQLANTNTFTAANLFAPGASAVVGLTAKASTAGGVDSLDVYDSAGTKQAYFDAAGKLNVTQTIQPTTNGGPNLGTTALAFGTLYAANVDSGSTTTTLNLGTTQATTITIGKQSGTNSLKEYVGSGNFLLDGIAASTYTIGTSTTTGSIAIGGTAQTGTVTLGSSTGTNTVSIANGTGASTVNIANSGTGDIVNIGAAQTTGTFTLGGTATTGTTTIGRSTAANIINIGDAATTTTQTINIGAAATGAGKAVVALGSLTAGSTTTLNGGTAASGAITANGSVLVKSQTGANSVTAFQVQNAAATPIFLVDTSTTANLITNPGFETGTTGWALSGSATIAQNTNKANAYHGQASLLVTTSASGGGASVASFTSTIASAQYTFSFYAMAGTNTGALGITIAGGGAPACSLSSTSLSTSGFQRYSCTFTASAAAVSAITIATTGGTSGTFYVDAAELNPGASAQPYAAQGAIQLRGTINSPVTFQSTSNSTSAFQIQNTAGTSSLFVADTLNNRVGIGTSTPGSTLDVNGTANATSYSVGGSAGLSSLTCTGGQVLQNSAITGGILTGGSCVAVGGGASTTLNNLGTTAINASLIPAINNAIDLGTAASVWNDLFVGNIDAGTTTTALNIGTSNASSIQVGKAGLAVSLPGGLSTAGGTINTGSGTITTSGTITGGQHTGTNGVFTNSTNALLLGTTNTAQINVTGSGAQTFSLAAGGTVCTTASGTCSGTYQVAGSYQAAGNYLIQAPAGTTNTVTAASGGQALIIKGTNGTTADLVDIYNTAATPALVSSFNQNGAFTTTAAITAPITGSTINGLVVNAGALSNISTITTTGAINTATITGGALSSTAVNGLSLSGGVISSPSISGTITGSGTPTITGFGTINGQTIANASSFVTSVTAPAFNATTTGGTITTNLGTLQRTTSGGSTTNIDLNDTVTTTLQVENSGSGVANLNLYGGALSTGTGATTRLTNAGALTNITGYTQSSGSTTFNQNATDLFKITASAVPTTDMAQITNTGKPITADGINAEQIDYYAALSNAAYQASALRVNITNTSAVVGATSNALRIVATANVASNTNGLKIDNVTSGSGTDSALNIGTGWDYVLNATNTQIDNSGNLTLASGGSVKFGATTICTSSGCTASSFAGGLVQNPATAAINTIAPTAAGVVGLTVKGTTGTAADVLDIYNSNATPTLQAYFNSAGSLNVSQVIQPTSNNTVDVGLSGTAFKDVYSTNFDSGSVTTALTIGTSNAASIQLGKTGVAISAPGGLTTGAGAITSTGTITGNLFSGSGASLTGLNPTNLVTGSGAITLQPAAAANLTLTTTGASAITITPGTNGLAENFAAGVSETQTATAVMTADLFDQTNTSATNAPTADGINLLQQTFFGKPAATNNESSTRINITNSNTAAGGQVNALRVIAVGAGTTVASDTDGILVDNFTNASSAGTENGLEVGTGWDSGFYLQSGGNTIKATSATALVVENATSVTSLSVNTTTGSVQIGSATADTTQINLQLDQFSTYADTGTCNATLAGALYYNASSNAIRGCVNSNWEDVITTSGLGLLTFGVIPDSSNAGTPGDIAGTTNNTNSPCKVTWLSATSVQVNPCAVYSGGRKVIVPTTTVSVATLAANAYANICLNGTGNQPLLGTGNAAETLAAVPAFSANNPVECLATVRASATAGNIGFIWDTRTFTNTQKEFVSVNSANSNGQLVIGTTTLGVAQTTATTAAGPLRGDIVATAGTASTTAINAIIAVRGPVFAKFISGGTATINNLLETINTTAGYGTSVAFAAGNTTNYVFGGLLQTSISTSCTTANTPASACQYAPLVDFQPSR